MAPVRETDEAKKTEQRNEQLRLEKLQRQKARSKTLFNEVVEKGQTQKTKTTTKQAANLRAGAKAKQAEKQSHASERLMARQGIHSNKFQQNLQAASARQAIEQKDTKARGSEARQTERSHSAKDSEAELRRVDRQHDRISSGREDKDNQKDGDNASGKQSQSENNKFGANQMATQQTGSLSSLTSAQQAQGAGSARLPPEVIQQMVQRVFLGVNKEGLTQFHIELQDHVLAGSSLSVACKDGVKIQAKFFCKDAQIRNLVHASKGELSRAFEKKGLSLERLDVVAP